MLFSEAFRATTSTTASRQQRHRTMEQLTRKHTYTFSTPQRCTHPHARSGVHNNEAGPAAAALAHSPACGFSGQLHQARERETQRSSHPASAPQHADTLKAPAESEMKETKGKTDVYEKMRFNRHSVYKEKQKEGINEKTLKTMVTLERREKRKQCGLLQKEKTTLSFFVGGGGLCVCFAKGEESVKEARHLQYVTTPPPGSVRTATEGCT